MRSLGRRSARLRANILTYPALVFAALAAPATALAQQAPQAQAEDDEVVIITARRRAENLQDTPVAVTVLTADSLERQQITSTTDLDQVSPNLQFASYGTLTGNNAAAQVFIRGIGQTDATPAVDPGVGLYIDEVYMGRSVGAAMEFRDVASVQVLRGPQGTLFGRNTIGGAVLISTNDPGAGNTVRIGLGEGSLKEGFAAFDLPSGETLSARVSGGFRKRDGYVTRAFDGIDLGNENGYNFQGTVRWRPIDSLTATLRGDYAKKDENGSPFVFQSINERAVFPAAASTQAGCPGATFPPPSVPATADPRCANDAQGLGPFVNGGTFPAKSALENSGLSLVAEWKPNAVLTLKSITSDRSLEWSGSRDADNTPLTILHTSYASRSDQFSQELQAQVEAGRLHGVAGVYYFDEDTYDRVIIELGVPGPDSYDTQRVNLSVEAYAAFTEWTVDVTDSLSLTGGLRYTEETKGIQGFLFNVVGGIGQPEPPIPSTLCSPAGTPSPCLFIAPNKFETKFTSTTGSASARYRWNDAIMTYASWSQGFKSGGYNQRYNATPPNNEPISFNEENAETVELGAKLNPMSGLRINGAVFSTKYDDIQLTYRLGPAPLLFNAGQATIKGAELEAMWAPTADLLIDASIGYLDDEFDSINNPAPLGGITPTATSTLASTLPFTPELQWHIGGSYTLHPTDDLLLTPRADVSYTDPQFFDAGNSPEIAQLDSVTTLNASLTLENAAGSWRFSINGNNLTDELYPVAGTSSVSTASGYAEIIYARPRNVTASLTTRF